ncbi:MAG: hypothetical protein J6B77_03595, partial [Clostridia bacterium]|nr:hypothetical protein [Clostridia bacterium]
MDLQNMKEKFEKIGELGKDDIRFYSVHEQPFRVYGLFYADGKFRRLPESVARTAHETVLEHHAATAGGRVRFKTDSPYIAIAARLPYVGKMAHFALTGSAGFDLYVKTEGVDHYVATLRPSFYITDSIVRAFDFGSREMREITVHFPLYSEISELYFGLQDGAAVAEAPPYAYEKPIVYYGHSITQGGCASRPGNAYPSILSRRLNVDHVNLGFSGGGRGEQTIVDYIADLDMLALVMDYDHNAPTAEHLLNTHERMFRAVREKHPTLPVLMMTSTTMPRFSDDRAKRREIIHSTYLHAKERGDENVYFWDGAAFDAY